MIWKNWSICCVIYSLYEGLIYIKNRKKIGTPVKIALKICLKIWTVWFYDSVMCPKDKKEWQTV